MLKKIINNQTIQGVVVQGFTAAFAFANIAVLNRSISTELFGAFMLFITVINIGEGLRNGYGQSFYQKVYHRKSSFRNILFKLSFAKASAVSLPLAFFSAIIAFFLFKNAWVVAIIVLHYALSIPQALVLWQAYTVLNYKAIFLLRSGFYILFIASVYVASLNFIIELKHLMLFWTGITFLTSIPFFFHLFKSNGGIKNVLAFGGDKQLSALFKKFGRFSAFTSGFGIMLRSSDPLMIALMLSNTQVAWFTVPQRLMEIPEILTRSIALNFAKNIAAKSDIKNRKMVMQLALKESKKGILILLVCAIFLAVFGNFILKILAPEFYQISYTILLCMLPYLLFLIADRVSGVMLDFFGYPAYNTLKVGVMFLINIMGNFIALYFFKDVRLVALVSSLTFITGVIFGWAKLRKIVNQ